MATIQTAVKLETTAEITLKKDLGTKSKTFTTNDCSKILIICGPTATGKTAFGLRVAKKFGGEIVSADSRQVYTGKNLIYGKGLPANLKSQISSLKWRGHQLKYYEINGVKIWLYDILEQKELFSVALWRECAQIVIEDIRQRGGLPIVVGGTGLYLKSLTQPLPQIHIPPNPRLRSQLANQSVDYLFNYLKRRDSGRAAALNASDRRNPRRLIRAIEISLSPPSLRVREGLGVSYLQIGLAAPKDVLYKLVDQRVTDRIASGAAAEDLDLAADPVKWQGLEHQIVRSQLTWFRKQPGIAWFEVSQPNWKTRAEKLISSWYNKTHA